MNEKEIILTLQNEWISGRTPVTSDWFVCHIGDERVILKYNVTNKFWADFAGKTYKPDEISEWLDDHAVLSSKIIQTRKKHKNAWTSWSKGDEKILWSYVKSGKASTKEGMKELVKSLERNEGAIKYRITVLKFNHKWNN